MNFFFLFVFSLLSNSEVLCQTVCTCDLTATVCDVNCCCDADCSSTLVATFPCTTAAFNTDSKLCDNTIIFVNNIPTTEVVQDNGVFCIVTDNRQERNSYTAPDLINTAENFDAALQQYPTFTYDLSTPSPIIGTFYKAGDTIDIRRSNMFGKLVVPVSGIASVCLENNPASFLNDEQSTCYRQLINISDMCQPSSFLDVNYYMTIEVAKLPIQLPIINTTNLASADFVNITLCNQSAVSAPTVIGSECTNAVSQITYQISFNGTSGISSVCLTYVTGNISDSVTQWPQTFNVTYLSANTNLSLVDPQDFRSGNPGYVTGKPLRTANSSTGNRTFAPNLLTLIPQTPSGMCSDAATANFPSINFREDARTGCLVSYTSTTACSDLNSIISAVLKIPSNVFVSTFGNTLISSTGDWIEVTASVPSITNQFVNETCLGIPLSLNYNMFYANTNNISNPQPKIIGIDVEVQTTTVSFQCAGFNCVSPQYLEVTTSVTFIDTSSSPAAVLKERPTVDTRVPSDFFFPFTSN